PESRMAQPQRINPTPQPAADPVWARVRSEAEAVVRQEPQIAAFIKSAVLDQDSLETAITQRISRRLDHPGVPASGVLRAFKDPVDDSPENSEAFRAEIIAPYDRDP